MSGRTFFDTNVLVYLFDSGSPAKQERARAVFAEHARAGQIVLSPQVLQEFYVTVRKKLARPLAAQEAELSVRHLAGFPIVPVDAATILRAIELHQSVSLSFWDALIIQAASEGSCKRIFSEDLQDGRRFGNLVITNPFKD